MDRDYDPETGSQVPADILTDAWADIQIDFADLMDMGSLKSILDTQLEVEALLLKYETTHNIVKVLRMVYDQELEEALVNWGFDVKLDPDKEAQYNKSLDRVLRQAKNLRIKILSLEGDIKRTNDESQSDPSSEKTEDDWIQEIVMLEDDAQHALDWDVKSVHEYAVRMKKVISKYKSKRK